MNFHYVELDYGHQPMADAEEITRDEAITKLAAGHREIVVADDEGMNDSYTGQVEIISCESSADEDGEPVGEHTYVLPFVYSDEQNRETPHHYCDTPEEAILAAEGVLQCRRDKVLAAAERAHRLSHLGTDIE